MGSCWVACRRGWDPGGRRDTWEKAPSRGAVVLLPDVGGLCPEVGVDRLSLGEWPAVGGGKGGLGSPGAPGLQPEAWLSPCPRVARERKPRASGLRAPAAACAWVTPVEPCPTLPPPSRVTPAECVCRGSCGVPPALHGGQAGGVCGRGGGARSLVFPPLPLADRCGDVALSWAGPKPRRTRDGHSWRMGPLFSLRPRAPLLSYTRGGAWKGRGAEPGPTPLPRPLPDGSWWGVWSPDAADPLRPPVGCVSRAALLPRGGVGPSR